MTRSPSKVVRGAILSAFVGVISVGISPGTLAIVLSGISPSFGELVGLSGVLSATPDQPAVNISSSGDTASAGSASDFGLSTELLLVDAASDVDGSPGAGSAAADATGNGLPAGLLALNDASLGSIGAQSFGSSASVNGGGAFNRSGTTSPSGASLPIADQPFILSENPAPGTTPTDSGSPEIVPGGDGPSEDVVPNPVTPVAFSLPLFITPAQVVPVVPAPATLLLLLAGMPGLLLLRRRRGRPTDGSGKV
jgi:hypothetical protein